MRKGIKDFRIERGLSAKDLAEIFDISESYYYMIEGGYRIPSYGLMMKIAKYFNKTPDYFFANDIYSK
ncbi:MULTISPECIES: helix-turn-helix transcriptional regulator [Aerococcus]|uniref:helix-turn-helix transcriptional regulator n=1 Tax=Aerococcus TaxID=1375 RepID=UPI0018A6EA2D|nr:MULTISPECIES: helix-turn-helix transcriptional regulator [Aerococcus]MCY3067640.1 helix-turn-helix transcriptional regulator [Aerococcus mictus]MCY3080458.1 helix-turn-helix transcriptional regulator [Aerococcus mictus]MDK8484521.1 helix-turn-helix transcriptional regulator [Aerococcus urinae]